MATKIQLKRNSSSGWAAENPVLSPGEPGVERNTGNMKIGNGTTAWNDLPYVAQRLVVPPLSANASGGVGVHNFLGQPGLDSTDSSANF